MGSINESFSISLAIKQTIGFQKGGEMGANQRLAMVWMTAAVLFCLTLKAVSFKVKKCEFRNRSIVPSIDL